MPRTAPTRACRSRPGGNACCACCKRTLFHLPAPVATTHMHRGGHPSAGGASASGHLNIVPTPGPGCPTRPRTGRACTWSLPVRSWAQGSWRSSLRSLTLLVLEFLGTNSTTGSTRSTRRQLGLRQEPLVLLQRLLDLLHRLQRLLHLLLLQLTQLGRAATLQLSPCLPSLKRLRPLLVLVILVVLAPRSL